MSLYRFSPIKNEEQLMKAVKYIVKQNTKLCKKIIGKNLPITSLTIFSHYQDEYQQLVGIIHKLGKLYNENNGPRVTLHKPIKVLDHIITHIRIRKPDPYRMQVGCSDFGVENYQNFKKTYLEKHPKNLRLIERQEYEMIELFDPNFDVLGYVVSKQVYLSGN